MRITETRRRVISKLNIVYESRVVQIYNLGEIVTAKILIAFWDLVIYLFYYLLRH